MTDDNSPQLRTKDLLEKNLYKLTNRFEEVEDKVELLDAFFTQLDDNQEENRCNLEKVEKRVAEIEVVLEKTGLLEERVSSLNIQNIELRNHINLMVDTLNNLVKILNNQVINEESTDEAPEAATPHEENPDGYSITERIKQEDMDMNEDTQHTLKKVYAMYEVTIPHEDMDEDTQPTLSQVYAMYQSQPPDEEGWDEMTAAIKAAEEYESSRKANQNE